MTFHEELVSVMLALWIC